MIPSTHQKYRLYDLLVRMKRLLPLPPYLWLILFFCIPLLIVFNISFSESIFGTPPYSSLISFAEENFLVLKLNLENYQLVFSDVLYRNAYFNSIKIAGISTLICLIIGYPMAYGISRVQKKWQIVFLIMVILPFCTSFLIRVYAWIGLLKKNGLLNNLLLQLDLISEPLTILNTPTAVYIGIVYSYLPFMIFSLYSSLQKINSEVYEAARDLGARWYSTFFSITVPMTLSGIITGCLMVFIPAIGEFVIPELLGGPQSPMIGKVLWSEFFKIRDWPVAAALAIVTLLLIVVPILIFQKLEERLARQEER